MINNYKPSYDTLSSLADVLKRIVKECMDYNEILKGNTEEDRAKRDELMNILDYFKERNSVTLLNNLLAQFKSFTETEGRYAVRKYANDTLVENYTVDNLNMALSEGIEYFNKPSDCHKKVTVTDIRTRKTMLSL